jgi:hypothetical protein
LGCVGMVAGGGSYYLSISAVPPPPRPPPPARGLMMPRYIHATTHKTTQRTMHDNSIHCRGSGRGGGGWHPRRMAPWRRRVGLWRCGLSKCNGQVWTWWSSPCGHRAPVGRVSLSHGAGWRIVLEGGGGVSIHNRITVDSQLARVRPRQRLLITGGQPAPCVCRARTEGDT